LAWSIALSISSRSISLLGPPSFGAATTGAGGTTGITGGGGGRNACAGVEPRGKGRGEKDGFNSKADGEEERAGKVERPGSPARDPRVLEKAEGLGGGLVWVSGEGEGRGNGGGEDPEAELRREVKGEAITVEYDQSLCRRKLY
jgi:hypothetical protein